MKEPLRAEGRIAERQAIAARPSPTPPAAPQPPRTPARPSERESALARAVDDLEGELETERARSSALRRMLLVAAARYRIDKETAGYRERIPGSSPACGNCSMYSGPAVGEGTCDLVRGIIDAADHLCDHWEPRT